MECCTTAKLIADRKRRIFIINKILDLFDENQVKYNYLDYENVDCKKQIKYINKLKQLALSENIEIHWNQLHRQYRE